MGQGQSSKFEGYRSFFAGDYEYLATYFEAHLKGSGTPLMVADQYTLFLEHYAKSGFEFYSCNDIPYRITPGCFAGLLGAKEQYGHSTVVTFRKKIK